MIDTFIKSIIQKIELNSVLVLFISLVCGIILLRIDNSFNTPAGIIGFSSICLGLGYTIISFILSIKTENFESVTKTYERLINEHKKLNEDVKGFYFEMLEQQRKGHYSVMKNLEGVKTMEAHQMTTENNSSQIKTISPDDLPF